MTMRFPCAITSAALAASILLLGFLVCPSFTSAIPLAPTDPGSQQGTTNDNDPTTPSPPATTSSLGCPPKEPEPWSPCTPMEQGISCNLGELYNGDPYCWKECDGVEWTHLCAGGGPPPPEDYNPPTTTEDQQPKPTPVDISFEGEPEKVGFDCATLSGDPRAGSGCDECLTNPNCDGWSPGFGCYQQCGYDPSIPGSFNVADVSCYSNSNGGCAKLDMDVKDYVVCDTQSDCTGCLATIKGDGRPCLWLEDDFSGGICVSSQGMRCCPVTECPASSGATLTITEPKPPTGTNMFDCHTLDGTDCETCLDQPGCGAWSSGQCYSKCTYDPSDPNSLNIADVSCYDETNGGCDAHATASSDWKVCSKPNDCITCMETEKPSGNGNCLWITDGTDNRVGGFCANEQGMMCCAATECPTEGDGGGGDGLVTTMPIDSTSLNGGGEGEGEEMMASSAVAADGRNDSSGGTSSSERSLRGFRRAMIALVMLLSVLVGIVSF